MTAGDIKALVERHRQAHLKAFESDDLEALALAGDSVGALNSLLSQVEALTLENQRLRVDAENWKSLLEAVTREIDDREYAHAWRRTENAPGHGHEKPGIWDWDNGEKAGKQCAWCLTWNNARSAIDAARSQIDKEK